MNRFRRFLTCLVVLAALSSGISGARLWPPLPATPRAQSNAGKWRLLTQLQITLASLRIVPHGNALFAWGGLKPGLFRSDDDGQSWQEVAGRPEGVVLSVFSFGDKLFLGIDLAGLFVSTDAGASWSRVGGGFASRIPKSYLARGATLFVGTQDVGVLRSDDGGVNWLRVNSGLPDNGSQLFVDNLSASGPNLIAATERGVFLSSNNGQSWRAPQQQVIYARERIDENGLPGAPILGSYTTALLLDGATVLVATASGGVFRSEDDGETWQESSAGLTTSFSTGLSVYGLARLGARLFASTFFGGVFCSDDGGRAWRPCQQGLNSRYPFRLFTLGNRIYATTQDTGLFVSTNRGESWSPEAFPQLTQTNIAAVRVLSQQGANLFALTAGAGLHVSINGANDGTRWEVWNNGFVDVNFHALAAGNQELFLLTRATLNTATILSRSTDGGLNWQAYLSDGLIYWNGFANPDFRPPGNLNAIARIGPHLYIGTERAGVKIAYNVDAKAWVGKRTADGSPAKAWTVANTGLTNLNVQSIVPFDNRVFAGSKGGVFVTADEGRNWMAANNGLTNPDVRALAASATHLFTATSGGVFASANRGQSWTAANAGLTDFNIQALAVGGAQLFAGTASGVFHSADNGQSWRALADGLTERNITALLVNGATLYAGTAEGRVFAIELPGAPARAAANVSAASYDGASLAPASIVSVFGAELATTAQAATVTPLPTALAGATVKVKDSAGAERAAQLLYVSPAQINYLLPAESAAGAATVSVTSGDGKLSTQQVQIAPVAPGVFTADASGRGLAAAVVLRVKADGAQSFEPVARYDTAQNRLVPEPIDLGEATDQVFLLLFCTGARNRTALNGVTVTIGGQNNEVIYAGAQNGFAGLDQLNIRLSRQLSGRGEVELRLTVDGKTANPVNLRIK